MAEGEIVRLREDRPRPSAEGEKAIERLRRESREASLEPPTLREWEARLGVDPRP